MKTTIVLHDLYCDVTYQEYVHLRNLYYKNPTSFKCFKIIVFQHLYIKYIAQEAGLEIKDLEFSGDYNWKMESIKKHFKTCMINFYQNIFLNKFSTIDNISKQYIYIYKDLKRDLSMKNDLLDENV